MPQKKGTKAKKAAKVKDLPARSVKAEDAAKVKAGSFSWGLDTKGDGLQGTNPLSTNLNIGGAILKK